MTTIKKIYLSIIIVGVLNIVLIIFYIFPLYRQIEDISKEIISNKEKMILLKQEKEEFQKLEEFYNIHQSDFNRIEHLFINPEIPLEFIQFLEQTASSSQIQLEISSMTKNKEKESLWPSLSFQLSLSGSLSNFLNFLKKIENSPYLIEFIDLNIKKSPPYFFLTINVFTK